MKFTRIRRPRMTKVPVRRESPPETEENQDYGAFLFADMWGEPSGMPLSANSALARLDVDPFCNRIGDGRRVEISNRAIERSRENLERLRLQEITDNVRGNPASRGHL